MSIKTFIDAQYKQWFLNAKGEVSFTKLGLQLAAVSGAIITFPASAAAIGIAVVVPPAIIAGAKLAGIIGLTLAGVRAKDTLDEVKK